MTAADFELLINLVGLKIVKMDTRFQAAVPFQGRLAVTLRFLATGDNQWIAKFVASTETRLNLL